MDVTAERRYPVNVEQLYGILTSRAFYQQRFQWGGVDDYRFRVFEPAGDGFRISIVQPLAIRLDKVPVFARKLLPAQADLTTEFDWRPAAGGYQADYRFQLGNVPVRVSGTMTLSADGADSCQIIRVTVRSSLPLVGRKLEQLIGERFERALEGDYRHTLRYIEEVHQR